MAGADKKTSDKTSATPKKTENNVKAPPPAGPRRSVTFYGDGTAEIHGFPPGLPGLEQVLGFIDLNVKPDELKRTLIANSRRAAASAAQGAQS